MAMAAVLEPRQLGAQRLDPITYTIQISAPQTQLIEVTATMPTEGRRTIDLMMPVWSPGYYRVEDYAANVRDLAATAASGESLTTQRVASNKWRIETRGAPFVKLFYRVFCNQRSVTTNYVDADYAVLNGAPTFITLA
jgi:predicted metalloprotease with PDZ domain